MLQNSKLISEAEDSYHIELPSGRKMTLEKKGLNEKAHAIVKKLKKSDDVQKFDDGGTAQGLDFDKNSSSINDVPQPDQAPAPSMSGSELMQSPQKYPQAPQPTGGEKLSSANQAYEAEKQATQKTGEIMGQEGAQEAGAIASTMNKINAAPSQQDVFNKYQASDEAFKNAMQSKTIDPDRYLNNMGTGSKIAAGIGMLLGGIGQGFGVENTASKVLQNSIERDIDAQKNDQSKEMNLWKMNRDKMGTEMGADLATQNQLYTGLKYKIEQAASQFKGPLAQQRAAAEIAQIGQKQADNNFKMSLMNSGDGDPAMKVQFLVPPERQKDVFEEIKNATNVHNNGPKILEAFDRAAKENTALRTGAGIRTPGSVMALHQLMLPNFKTIDGTVRQAAMDESFHNLTPSAGDFDSKIKEKRAALVDWLESEKATPTAKGFGIDLSKHQQTAPMQNAPETKSMNGVNYQKVPGGWQKVK
jgi:hypothetical protein